jgi:hypothetical protein
LIEIAWFVVSCLIAAVIGALVMDAYRDTEIAKGNGRLEAVAWRDFELFALLGFTQILFAGVAVVVMLMEPSLTTRYLTISFLFGGQVVMLVAALRRWWKRKRGLR